MPSMVNNNTHTGGAYGLYKDINLGSNCCGLIGLGLMFVF